VSLIADRFGCIYIEPSEFGYQNVIVGLFQIGFLYLRYVAEPKTLWTWYEPYIKDDEVFVSTASALMLLLV
jgi:hypothetical protein